MAYTPDEMLLGRIDDIEAKINGICVYLAAKEAGIALDINHEMTKKFLRANVNRPFDTRLQKTGVMADDGFWDAASIANIHRLAELLKANFKSS